MSFLDQMRMVHFKSYLEVNPSNILSIFHINVAQMASFHTMPSTLNTKSKTTTSSSWLRMESSITSMMKTSKPASSKIGHPQISCQKRNSKNPQIASPTWLTNWDTTLITYHHLLKKHSLMASTTPKRERMMILQPSQLKSNQERQIERKCVYLPIRYQIFRLKIIKMKIYDY